MTRKMWVKGPFLDEITIWKNSAIEKKIVFSNQKYLTQYKLDDWSKLEKKMMKKIVKKWLETAWNVTRSHWNGVR